MPRIKTHTPHNEKIRARRRLKGWNAPCKEIIFVRVFVG